MNQRIKKLVARFIRGAPVILVLVALWAATAPLNAEAALAGSTGNTIIRNTITVAYKDANSNVQTPVSATIDITVNTVAATPSILSVAPSPGSTDGTGATQLYTYTVRTNSNGPGAITFSTAYGTFANVAAGTVPTIPGSIYLGSTIIDPSDPKTAQVGLAIGSTVTYLVPNDGGIGTDSIATGSSHSNDGIINGLTAGDTVWLYSGAAYIGPFTVFSVADPVPGTYPTNPTPAVCTIVLTNASGGPLTYTPALGWQIVEQKTVTVNAYQGVVASPASAASWVTTLNATMPGAATPASMPVTTNALMGLISVTKYARNTVTNAGGTGTSISATFNTVSKTYYPAGITGNPGQILEYLAVIQDSGTGSSTAVYATDITPTYVSLVTGLTYGTGSGTVFARAKIGAAGTETDLQTGGSGLAGTAYGKSTGTTAGSTMTFNLGAGCANSFPGGGGTLTTLQTAYVIYQVKID